LRIYLGKKFDSEIMFLHGGVSMSVRDDMIRRFQSGKDSKIFILSLKAGGVGLNLTKANHVFHFDRWWNPAVENQATDRAFRIGQKKNVQVYKYICQGTLEERIDELIEQKQQLADYIVTNDESWLTEMDNEQIASLITLSRKVALE
jgi:SNF2 family DNA or RNA helicase